jgi:hypothetical protein
VLTDLASVATAADASSAAAVAASAASAAASAASVAALAASVASVAASTAACEPGSESDTVVEPATPPAAVLPGKLEAAAVVHERT